MSKIKVNAIDQNIAFLNLPKIYSGDVNTDFVQFEFDDTWNDFIKTAVFYRDVEHPYFQVVKDDECIIPHEVLKEKGKFYLGVVGVLDDKVLTSEVIAYEIGQGATTPIGEIVPEPTKDIYQQILNELNTIRDLSNDTLNAQTEFIAEQEVKFNDYVTETDKSLKDMTDNMKQEVKVLTDDLKQDTSELESIITDINNKLAQGEFDGRTVLYGEGAPSNDIGRDSDVYIDVTTYTTLDDGNYCFVKDNGAWSQTFKMNGKDGADTLPTNSIIQWDTSNPIPDGYEEVDISLCPRQLLINNDFQVNQRDKEKYTDIGRTWGYTLDMWKCIDIDVTPLTNGVKVENLSSSYNNYFLQHIDGTSGTYTVVIKCNSVSGTVILNQGDKPTLKQGLNIQTFTTNELTEISLELKPNSSFEIEYIDLFEGDIAYPHVKEDYGIALARCLPWIERITPCVISVIFEYVANKNFLIYFNYTRKHNLPTIEIEGAYAHNAGGNIILGTVTSAKANSTIKGEMHCKFDESLTTKSSPWANILISCEPL